jgi:hypothetical protein
MRNHDLIPQAIRNKQQIIATYNGHRREMCLHAIGRKNEKEQALFYQCGGTSSSGLNPSGSPDNWRCIPLRGLRNVQVVDGDWHTAPNHSRPQTCVGQIEAEVSY